MEITRELDEGDVLRLEVEERGVTPVPLKALRERHHRLARLLAEGRKPAEVSLITGYSLSRISILQADPSFRELVVHYTGAVKEAYVQVHENIGSLRNAAVAELSERIEEQPESFSNRELLDIAVATGDRSGFGPKSKVEASVMVLTSEDIQQLKAQENASIIDVSSRSTQHTQAQESGAVGDGPALTPITVAGIEGENTSPAKRIDVSTPRNGQDLQGIAQDSPIRDNTPNIVD